LHILSILDVGFCLEKNGRKAFSAPGKNTTALAKFG
jgi:hypothetical protein